MRQNLHALIMNLPENLQTMADSFRLTFRPVRKGTLASDAMAADEMPNTDEVTFKTSLEAQTVELLGIWKSQQPELSKIDVPQQGFIRRKVTRPGTDIMPEKLSFSDSLVVLGDAEDWCAAQIESIFDIVVYPHGEKRVYTLCKLKYFTELSGKDISEDLYRRHTNIGRVFYMRSSSKAVVSVKQVSSHFCMTPDVFSNISAPHMHALPLVSTSRSASRINAKRQIAVNETTPRN